VRTMRASHPNIEEGTLFAKVDYEARVQGAQYLAYPPVVAGGPRANIIHYISNNQRVHDGELILMDAGWSYVPFGLTLRMIILTPTLMKQRS